MNENKLETVSIPGVEIFSTGTWNGDKYSEADLDAMVEAFGKAGFQPPVKAGHANGQEDEKKAREVFGAPNLGLVSRIYRVGQKLLADIAQVPKRFADMIRTGRYNRVSSEIYWNFKDETTGQKYPRVLKAIAFLGADIPALTNLKAIESLYKKSDSGALYAYDARGNEYHAYDGMEMAPAPPYQYPKKDKVAVNYVMADGNAAEKCSTCKFYLNWDCALVEGEISPQAYCDLYEPRAYEKAPDANWRWLKEKMEKILSYLGGDGEETARRYMIEKRGDEWCLIAKSTGKTLGCHKDRAGALSQEAAIKAGQEGYARDVQITTEEMENVCPDCARGMREKNFTAVKIGRYDEKGEFHFQVNLPQGTIDALCSKFGASEGFRTRCIAWAENTAKSVDTPEAFCNALKIECKKASNRQEAKEHSQGGDDMEQKEKEQLEAEKKKIEADFKAKEEATKKEYEERLAAAEAKAKTDAEEKEKRLQSQLDEIKEERRVERIDGWLRDRKREGKIAPVEEPRLKAIFVALPENGMIATYAKDDGTQVKQPVIEIIKELIEKRPSLFKQLSKTGDEPEAPGSWANAGDEVESKTRTYMKEKSEKNYETALRAVLRADPDLNERYMRLQQ